MGVDPAAVDIGAVERTAVVKVVVAAPAHDQGVIARDGDIVEEHVTVGTPPHCEPVTLDRKALAGASAPGANDQRRSVRNHLLQLHRLQFPCLAYLVRGRGGAGRLLGRRQEGPAPVSYTHLTL